MKFLADMGVSQSIVQWLRSLGHEATHLLEQGLERMPDAEILSKARSEGLIVITFDLDFGEIMAAGRFCCPSVITVRLRNQRPENVQPRLAKLLDEQEEKLMKSVIVTIDDAGYRIRQLPMGG